MNMETHNPPRGNMILAVTKSNKSNIPNPNTVMFLVTPSESEQNIPKKIQNLDQLKLYEEFSEKDLERISPYVCFE